MESDWVVSSGARAAAAAGAYAAGWDRPLLEVESLADQRLDALLTDAESVFVVGEIDHAGALSMTRRAASVPRERGYLAMGCPLGFLPGEPDYLERKLAQLAAASARGSAADVILDGTASIVADAPLNGLAVLDYRRASAATLREAGPMRLLALTGHGMSDLFHVGDDFICGMSRELTGRLGQIGCSPSCVQNEPVCLHKPGGIGIRAYDLDADHILMNACGTALFEGGEFGPEFALWSSAVDGLSRSYVGSLRWKDGHGLESLLYRQLLQAGFPLGTAVTILNSIAPFHHLEREPTLCLLGDPAERIGAHIDGQLDLSAAGVIDDGEHLACPGGLAVARVTNPRWVQAFNEDALLVGVRGGGDVHVSLVPSRVDGELGLFAYCANQDVDGLGIRLVDERGLSDRVNSIRGMVTTTLTAAGGASAMYPNAVRQGGRLNVESRLLNIARLRHQARTEPKAVTKLLRAEEKLLGEVAALDLQTATYLFQQIQTSAFRFAEHYKTSFGLAQLSQDDPCPACGTATVIREQRSFIDTAVSRSERICPGCGSLGDVPDQRLSVALESPDLVIPGEEFTVNLTVTNPGLAPVSGYAAIGVRRGDRYGASGPDAPAAWQVQGSASATVASVHRFPAEAIPHFYDLQAGVVTEGRIYIARRPLGVVSRR